MRYESSVTSISWIPSETIPGIMRFPFEVGPLHYDDPPPDSLGDLQQLRRSGAIRFANELRAWIEVEGGEIIGHGMTGSGWMGKTNIGFGSAMLRFPSIGMRDIRPDPVATKTSVRFMQTTGGRVAAPMPRKLNRPPFVQVIPPVVWTTLALTLNVDRSSGHEVVGASPFPRHWIYDDAGDLVQKVAVTDFKAWSGDIFGQRTPWGAEDSPAFVTAVESAVERELSERIMRGGAKPDIRVLPVGKDLVEQGAPGADLFLLLDGVLAVMVDGTAVAEVGPGAILGERAVLEGGVRTATLRAVTPARVAVATRDQLSPEAIAEVASGHRREDGHLGVTSPGIQGSPRGSFQDP